MSNQDQEPREQSRIAREEHEPESLRSASSGDMNLPENPDRRRFLGKAGTLGTAALAASVVPLQPMLSGKGSEARAAIAPNNYGTRTASSMTYRKKTAQSEFVDVGLLPDNGDASRFTDFSGNFSKSLLHDSLGIPNRQSWLSLKNALTIGDHEAFERIIMGTPGGGANSKLNGPQAALAYDLEGLDSHATVIPPAASVASAQAAAEQVEHYWAALLRDVPFTEYESNAVAAQAVADMNKLSFIAAGGGGEYPLPVSPANLFRGQIYAGDGNVKGPYVSQFLLQPTFYGSQPLSQMYQTYLPVGAGGSNYMTDPGEFQAVQNGADSGRQLAIDPVFRYVRSGRDLSAYTHVDQFYQAALVAFLVLVQLNAPLNPRNPYIHSSTQKAFGTLGAPDAIATLAEMATRAFKAAWFHKWMVNMRLRPEEYGALVHANRTNAALMPLAAAALNPDVFNSAALPLIYSVYNSYLLPQAFPEGSPTHPCYPTGHGTVIGACVTALKFFFNGKQKLRPLLTHTRHDIVVPTADGLSLQTYAGSDRDELDINGELSKLAFNISFGHGIHAGIHFRSSSYWSILLGEQVGLSVLRDRARSYNEPFSIEITRFDGTTEIISNQ